MSEGVGINDLPSFKDRFVTVQIDTSDDEHTPDDFKEVTGKVIAVSEMALVIQSRSDITMIEVSDILEIDEVIKFTSKGSLIVRELARVSSEGIRQHLLDRHGLPVEEVQAIPADAALIKHAALHAVYKLGHVHGQREKGRPGRKPKKPSEVTNGNPVQLQTQDHADGGATDVRDS